MTLKSNKLRKHFQLTLFIIIIFAASCEKLDIKRQDKVVCESVEFDGVRIKANINVIENSLNEQYGVILLDKSASKDKKIFPLDLGEVGEESFILNDLALFHDYEVTFYNINAVGDTAYQTKSSVISYGASNSDNKKLLFNDVSITDSTSKSITVKCEFIKEPSFPPKEVGVYVVLENTSNVVSYKKVPYGGTEYFEITLDNLNANSNYFVVVEAEFHHPDNSSDIKFKYTPFPTISL